MSLDTVGTLLAAIANSITEALRILNFSDKRQWGLDEHHQVQALELALDEARKDFQELSPLVNGQVYYQNDANRKPLSPSLVALFAFFPVSLPLCALTRAPASRGSRQLPPPCRAAG